MAARLPTASLKQEADNHLREIRRRKGVDGLDGEHNDNVEDLNRALDILSDQLYQKPTHFLLELIQNADDNTFENDVAPTVSFHVVELEKAWQMRIGCNEVGFEKENIEALCRIGYSTKKVKDRTKGYIGEKGIGFKSVFKVADVVHISSKAYSFRLDRRGILGMIAPVIETFPPANLITGLDAQPQGTETQLLLELLSKSEFESINDELQKLKPTILVFLRKIQKLIIHTPDRDVQFEIQREIEDQLFDGKETATLTTTSLHDEKKTEEKYLIVRYLENLPADVKDDRRENVEATEVVLAFPVDKKIRPLMHSQDTYAFLPINDYGFHYLIQGDFLLVANRESVDSSKWNKNVLVVVYRAFFIAVCRFNKSDLQYTWPLFLKDRGGTLAGEFWSDLKRWIFDQLSRQNVLQPRWNGKLVLPTSLFYIPPEFRLQDEPLVEDRDSRLHHLSFRYDLEIKNILPELKQMGVKQMEFSHFYQELIDLMKKLGDSFVKSQSKEWHSKVSKLFCRYSTEFQAAKIPLIPLRDGQWVTSSQSHLFLEGDTTGAAVPGGLDIFLVDHEACKDANRMAFFRWADIKKCDQAEVCRMIMQLYNPTFRGRSLKNSVQDLIYLFQTPRSVYDEPIEKFQLSGAGKFENFRYTRRLYIEYPNKKSIISKYAQHPENPMPTLSPIYINAIEELGQETEFFHWACSYLNLSSLPRLADEHELRFPTPEFDFLKVHAVKDLLLLLRDNWDHYARYFKCRTSRSDASVFKDSISGMKVHCIDGLSRRLDQTVLPLKALKLAGPDLAFIDIPEPNDIGWLKFSTVGVFTNLSPEFYLRELQALAALPVTDNTSKSVVEAIYVKLGSSEAPSVVRAQFINCRLVYLQKLKRWVFLSDCVWNGPPQVNSVHKISSEYPRCSKLFRDCLLLGNVTLDHVIKELQSVTASTSFDTLQQLLLLLNKYLTPKVPPNCLSELRRKKIIPVTERDGEHRMDFNIDMFYLADRQSLWDLFSGKIPLIAFDVKTVRALNPLINAMNLSKYLLSVAVKQNFETVGLEIEDKERTDDLRERTQYFLQLVTKETAESKHRLLTRLVNLNVWGVPAIKSTHKVYGTTVTTDTGHIRFDDLDDSKLEIYISIKNASKAIVEFELSEKFIRYCGITDDSFKKLALPILQYPLEQIGKLLEDHGLDEPDNHDEKSNDLCQSISEESNDDCAPILQIDAGTVPLPSTPSSGMNISVRGSSSQVSRPSSWRDRIPALDQSISSVRMAAALPSTTPTLMLTPPRIRVNPSPSLNRIPHDTTDSQYFAAGNELLSAVNVMDKARQSRSFIMERDAEDPHDAFDLRNFHTVLPDVFGLDTPSRNLRASSTQHQATGLLSAENAIEEAMQLTPFTTERGAGTPPNAVELGNSHSESAEVFGLDTPSRNPRTSLTQHHSVPRYGRSPHTPGGEPDPASTMYGLQMLKIGLMGETFINEWLSRHLESDWDPSHHWTSRNRNDQYPNSPFTGREKEYADFTYPDTNGALTKLLMELGFLHHDVQAWLSDPPKYHIEVKSTSENCKEPFYMSNNQVGKAREWTIAWDNIHVIPKNVYMVIRVYNLDKETNPDFTMYVDPWAMYLARDLNFLARENYSVTPKDQGN